MNILQRIRATLLYRYAVTKANSAATATENRQYVMPTFDGSRKVVVMDRYNFRKYKQKGYIDERATVRDLERECFYCTPYTNGTHGLSKEQQKIKQQNFFNWYQAMLLLSYSSKKR